MLAQLDPGHVVAVHVWPEARMIAHDQIPRRPDLATRIRVSGSSHLRPEYPQQHRSPSVHHRRRRPKQHEVGALPNRPQGAIPDAKGTGKRIHGPNLSFLKTLLRRYAQSAATLVILYQIGRAHV